MIEAVSCGGVVIHRGKVLLLYKNQNGRYMGWVMPKGTVEDGESHHETALREVREESNVINPKILAFIGETHYNFKGLNDTVKKTVYWYLMSAESFHSKPQAEEFFMDSGFYKQHEALYLLKFHDEKQIMKQAYIEYNKLKSERKDIS